jgi:hypothetical protein
MTFVHLFACDGCFAGFPAILSLVIAVVVLIGSIYTLLWSNLGARQAYLVLMVALSAWMILLSAMWLFGAPGTTPGTGPRGREAAWVPFTPTSDQAKVYQDAIAKFPSGWDKLGTGGDGKGIYPGKIDSHGELINVTATVSEAEARLAAKQGTQATDKKDWAFVPSDLPPQPGQEDTPKANVRFYMQDGTPLLFGAVIPATDKHPQTTVFAYRDKGLVYLYALYFLLVSILGFAVHLWLLGRYERRSVAAEAAMTSDTATAKEPALT